MVSDVSFTLHVLLLMGLATSSISTAASVSDKTSKASELLLHFFPYMCIFTVFLNKTNEFVSVVQDKMKQTELGEVIGRCCQDQSEEGEGAKALQIITGSQLLLVVADSTTSVF